FAIVGENGQAVTLRAQLPQVGRRLLGRAKRNHVAEPLVDREESDAAAVRLRVMGLVQLVVLEAADEKMPVIYQRVLDARFRKIRGQLRLPHTLRKPQSARLHSEAPLQELAHTADLLEPIGAGKRRENRLVEYREQQLQPAIRREPADHVEP